MIDPTNITNYNRTEAELEEFLLFCILVAGKNSKVQAKKLQEFLDTSKTLGFPMTSPFHYLSYLVCGDLLSDVMKATKLGQYARLKSAFEGVLKLQGVLSSVTLEDLLSIKGVGPKTARFFLLHTRPNQSLAVLDTHLLRHLRDEGYNAPYSTPHKELYEKLEKVVLDMASKKNMTPADFDLMIWTKYSQAA